MTGTSRRRFLGVAAGTGLAMSVPGCGLLGQYPTGELLRSRALLPDPFSVPLPIPPVLRPSEASADADLFEIEQREAFVEILPGLRTPIFGYNGIFPGPTVQTRSGRSAEVQHTNRLPVPVVVHLHGGHTPAEFDGYPLEVILPVGGLRDGHGHAAHVTPVGQGSFTYRYPMTQRAATLWYHDHRMDFTGPSVHRGLAGFHIVRDEEEDALPLPGGEREIPLMITDRSFDEDGSFRYPALDPTMLERPGVWPDFMEGVLGDVVLVNGAPWPVHEVGTAMYRLRLLNASNARRYQLALEHPPLRGSPFTQIGSDGGLLSRPIKHDEIRIAPGERFDTVVDFAAYPVGAEVTMVNTLGRGTTRDVMRFKVVRREREDATVPPKLCDIERLRESDAVVKRHFRFGRGRPGVLGDAVWLINGDPFDPERTDATPRLGQLERWRFSTDVHHPIHVHLDSFQVLNPGRWDHGWKDTVDILPTEYVDVLVRFNDYAGKYVFHCHNLEHEDMMMMANFEVE